MSGGWGSVEHSAAAFLPPQPSGYSEVVAVSAAAGAAATNIRAHLTASEHPDQFAYFTVQNVGSNPAFFRFRTDSTAAVSAANGALLGAGEERSYWVRKSLTHIEYISASGTDLRFWWSGTDSERKTPQ